MLNAVKNIAVDAISLVWLELLMFGLAVVTYLIFTGGSASQFLSTSQRSRVKEWSKEGQWLTEVKGSLRSSYVLQRWLLERRYVKGSDKKTKKNLDSVWNKLACAQA